MTEYKNRYSVKVSTLQTLEQLITYGCYEQAIEIIKKLYDPNERLKDKREKNKAYWEAKNAKDENTRRVLWAKYKALIDDSMF